MSLPSLIEDEFVTVDAHTLTDTVRAVLRANGADAAGAQTQATHLIEAELRGHPSHGVRRLPIIVERLRAGFIVPGVEPEFSWVTDSVLRVDGRNGFGPAVAWRTVELVAARAASTGITLATVSAANHIGMLSPYVEELALGGWIAIALTTSEALVHPWGGSRALVGTNPIAIAVPSATDPIVLDMSTSAVSMGKVIEHSARGIPIPAGWAVDEHGESTTDATAATSGAISPFGGAKGFALGLTLEAMVGVLSATALGRDVHGTLDAERAVTKGDVFICIDVERIGVSAMLPVLSRYLEEVRDSGDVRVPGDRSRVERAHRLTHGITLDPALWDQLTSLTEGVHHD
ncbi:Ldh family oxidoreductase [Lacisediminihabitans profunda]|uniref:Ldh family oxidoreductase n=1 Tax=Lacisediminihabitans profunda TaxID=2594790 RepID=A0A5C8URA7_9MICO|nr:Ldh family oxidoreductase [Lacisediminihabitans profunda]TXN29997.1 Ldh family oxidoreductase [Lacisediminihabitans profunda]